MGAATTQIFLGDTPISFYYVGTEQVGLNPINSLAYIVRNDAFAQYIKLAIPYSLFPSLGMNNYYDNIAALVSGSGTSLPMVPTGSNVNTAPPILQTTSSIVSSGSYNFANDGYSTAIYISGSQNAGTVTGSLLNFGTQKFVVESWFNYNEVATGQPPFNMFFFGTTDGTELLLDAPIIAATFRATGQINASAAWNKTKNVWFHLAYVSYGSGNGSAIYLNGNRIVTGTAGTIGTPANGYWRVLGSSAGSNNDGAGKLIQDFRLYLGTDKNYTGSIIPVPESIVTTTSY